MVVRGRAGSVSSGIVRYPGLGDRVLVGVGSLGGGRKCGDRDGDQNMGPSWVQRCQLIASS